MTINLNRAFTVTETLKVKGKNKILVIMARMTDVIMIKEVKVVIAEVAGKEAEDEEGLMDAHKVDLGMIETTNLQYHCMVKISLSTQTNSY